MMNNAIENRLSQSLYNCINRRYGGSIDDFLEHEWLRVETGVFHIVWYEHGTVFKVSFAY